MDQKYLKCWSCSQSGHVVAEREAGSLCKSRTKACHNNGKRKREKLKKVTKLICFLFLFKCLVKLVGAVNLKWINHNKSVLIWPISLKYERSLTIIFVWWPHRRHRLVRPGVKYDKMTKPFKTEMKRKNSNSSVWSIPLKRKTTRCSLCTVLKALLRYCIWAGVCNIHWISFLAVWMDCWRKMRKYCAVCSSRSILNNCSCSWRTWKHRYIW